MARYTHRRFRGNCGGAVYLLRLALKGAPLFPVPLPRSSQRGPMSGPGLSTAARRAAGLPRAGLRTRPCSPDCQCKPIVSVLHVPLLERNKINILLTLAGSEVPFIGHIRPIRRRISCIPRHADTAPHYAHLMYARTCARSFERVLDAPKVSHKPHGDLPAARLAVCLGACRLPVPILPHVKHCLL